MKNGSLLLRPFLLRRAASIWQQQLITELLPSNGWSYRFLLSGRCLAEDACHINNNNNDVLLCYYEQTRGKGITRNNIRNKNLPSSDHERWSLSLPLTPQRSLQRRNLQPKLAVTWSDHISCVSPRLSRCEYLAAMMDNETLVLFLRPWSHTAHVFAFNGLHHANSHGSIQPQVGPLQSHSSASDPCGRWCGALFLNLGTQWS